ncbi:hypothetical protein B0T24DRAFT_264195 [Lasiosphaeria ovina]|uniref:Uncharacterized protein n=1 Tax=Lasiosphaeria ovina TaxID=92902 RepID=A0AAE0N8L5_9PEZI|nr:hypothetical protein B0T24DRAFT_264195 [Lasiosphaeria ovina]
MHTLTPGQCQYTLVLCCPLPFRPSGISYPWPRWGREGRVPVSHSIKHKAIEVPFQFRPQMHGVLVRDAAARCREGSPESQPALKETKPCGYTRQKLVLGLFSSNSPPYQVFYITGFVSWGHRKKLEAEAQPARQRTWTLDLLLDQCLLISQGGFWPTHDARRSKPGTATKRTYDSHMATISRIFIFAPPCFSLEHLLGVIIRRDSEPDSFFFGFCFSCLLTVKVDVVPVHRHA